MRIALEAGRTIGTPAFSTGVDSRYSLFILSHTPPGGNPERVDCLLGLGKFSSSKRACDAETIDIGWSVQDAASGATVASGSSHATHNGFYDAGAAREIGSFVAQSGASYAVRLQVNRDGGELKDTSPELVVQTYPGEWKEARDDVSIARQLRRSAFAVFAAAGVIALFLPWLVHRNWSGRKRDGWRTL